MNKNYTTAVLFILTAIMSFGQNSNSTSLKDVSGEQSSPYIVSTNQTYTSCGYLQEDNALEDGRASDDIFPLICADDFLIPAGDCWDIQEISVPFFVPAAGPGEALGIDIYIMSDNAGLPGTVLQNYSAVPADWTTTLKGNNFGLDAYTYDITLGSPINLCGGGAGTTYWLAVQVQANSGTFYWEFANGTGYGDNGANASDVSGTWTAGTDNFVFEMKSILEGTDVLSACNSYTWIDGNTYTSSNNTATHTLTNAAGCDSIVTLDLTIDQVDISVINNSPTLTASANPATFQWVDCDDNYSVISGETSNQYTATSNGNYAVIVTQNGCSDTSDCEIVNNIGLADNELNNHISLYPNPTNGLVSLTSISIVEQITVFNATGQVVLEKQTNAKKLKFDLSNDPRGVYIVSIRTADGVNTQRLIKD